MKNFVEKRIKKLAALMIKDEQERNKSNVNAQDQDIVRLPKGAIVSKSTPNKLQKHRKKSSITDGSASTLTGTMVSCKEPITPFLQKC